MKIDLNKEEWEMLQHIIPRNIELHKISGFGIQKNIDILEKIYEKLGREWIEEEEEMLKFHEGFAYRKKMKDE